MLLAPVKAALVSLLVSTLFSTALLAETVADAGPTPLDSEKTDPLAMTNLWQLTLGMLLVLGLIMAIAWVLKRSGRFQVAAGGGMRVLGGLSMGARERVVLMQVGDQQLLIGVAPGRVQTLHVLENPVGTGEGSETQVGFSEQLGRLIRKGAVR